ncbi:hypothetical protein H1V43_24265 [Streptomyces sp. PSKA54]|uniref:Uncharacterized protein n=1 Tax=Streptomyces himalayensis subsp. aureolus TaxID=2758039 RepID=A0A7W2D4F4_9ACTN|nr:hypothetical protein [Streptomyces himalayensis]MBA4864412.1 hypothetical protein [Streptomyces himalayensis subsp. aureolus]
MPGPAYQPVPPAKPKGRARKVFGVLLVVFGVLPLLGAALTVYQNFKNAKQQNSNDAFIPKAWHNLKSDELFPDRLTHETVDGKSHMWARQGIAKETSCKEAFPADFVNNVMADRCKFVLRATYTDLGGEMAATIGLVVAGSPDQAREIVSEIDKDQSEKLTKVHVPTVRPFAVPGTPAAEWSEAMGIGGASEQVFMVPESPYAVTITIGPTDPSRSVGQLPEPWDLMAHREKRPYRGVAENLANIYAQDLQRTVQGK